MFTSEKRVSILRVLLFALNTVVFVWFMDHTYTNDPLAYGVLAIANVYALITLVFQPYKKFKVLRSIYFTTVSDGALATLLIVATGYMDSPYYLIWYISLVSIAFRYTLQQTVITTFIYLLLYMCVFILDGNSTIELSDFMLRLGYIPLAGMLGMFVSLEITDQLDGKMSIIRAENALKQAHHELEMKVETRTNELRLINKDLTDSISYAHRIQSAILPKLEDIAAQFEQFFVIHLPKDIVSGDFYWFHHRDGISHLAVVDCTGHGVPGAMMSMIGNNLLNSAIIQQRIVSPSEVLQNMDKSIGKLLKDDEQGLAVNDGMDLSLCMIDHRNNIIEFAGAQSMALFLRNGELLEIRGNKFSIGGFGFDSAKEYQTTRHTFSANDQLFLFSDGFQDQFGGMKGKKFYRKNLINLIDSCSDRPMKEQRETINSTFFNWKGNETQMDDVTVLGVKF